MHEHLQRLAQGLARNDGASVETLAAVQQRLGVDFPDDLIAFLRESNGAEGSIGDGYLQLYSIEVMAKLYEMDSPEDQRFVAFASDGGGETYSLDKMHDPPRIVEMRDSADARDQNIVGTTLADLLGYTRGGYVGGGWSRPLGTDAVE